MSEKKRYIITLLHKLPYEERNIYRRHALESEWEDMYASENREVGDPAVYGQLLDATQLDEFQRAENVKYIEEAREQVGYPNQGPAAVTDPDVIRYGVEKGALEYHGFMDSDGPSGEGVIVGVGDTGFSPHPYTEKRIVGQWNFTDSPDSVDRDGHGSWCQGAATPWGASLVSGKVLGDNGSGWTSWGIAFVRRFTDFCTEQGKPGVISLSLGGGGYSRAYEDACRYASERGVIVIAAAGNEGKAQEISSPANCPSAFSVGAISYQKELIAYFSNRDEDPREPDIYAAGVDLRGQGSGLWSGTSMATPIVARASARAMSVKGAKVGQVKFNLLASAKGRDRFDGHGRLAVPGLMRRTLAGV